MDVDCFEFISYVNCSKYRLHSFISILNTGVYDRLLLL